MIDWGAVARAQVYHKSNQQTLPLYVHWMLDINGIDHGTHHIKVVDEKKYLMFLLRWG